MGKVKEPLVPAIQAAMLMHISKQRLYAYINAGKIKAEKQLGTRWHIPIGEIKRFNNGEIDVSGVYSERWKNEAT